MKYYFILQFKRLKRDIKNFGIDPYAGMGIAMLAFILISISLFNKTPLAPYLYIFVALMLVFFLGAENRNQFLRSAFFKKEFQRLRLFENWICVFPFLVFLLFKGKYLPAALLLVAGSLLSFHHKAGTRMNFVVPSPFSKRPYEFTTGFRSLYWLLIIIYCVTGLSVYHHNLNLGLFSLLAVFFLCMSFYSHLDPVFYVWIHAQSARQFLKEKIKTALFYSLYISLPVSLVLILANPSQAMLIAGIFLLGFCYVLLNVLSVYVQFPGRMTVSQYFLLYGGILFPPVLLFVIPYFYLEAVRRLKDYLLC